MEWQPLSLAPPNERILVRNELWADSFGEVQIAERDGKEWTFDSGMDINDMDELELGDGLKADDYLPQGWMRLPSTNG